MKKHLNLKRPKMNDQLVSQIDALKEVLSAMPLKTKKNKKAYLDKVKEIQKEYTNMQKEVKKELVKRVNKIKDIYENEEINQVNIEINNLASELYLINNYLTSFEKLGLDRVTYGLNHFYKENLTRVNKIILKAINLFKDVGIDLTPAYFDYSHYTYDYMQVFFKEMNDLKSQKLKDTFESIYWKCPDIITHLCLNIKYLYYLNEDKLNKYYQVKHDELLEKENKTEEEIIEDYHNKIAKRDLIISEDAATILKDFINKKKLPSDYEEAKINKCYAKLVSDSDYLMNNKDSLNENIIKLNYSLIEYQNYLAFKYINEDIKTRYNEKDTYKNKYKDALKGISKDEDNLRKINYKIFKMKEKNPSEKNKIDDLLNQTETMVIALKEKYNELDNLKFNDQILNLLNNNSTYLDVLKLAQANYSYVTTLMQKNEPELTEDEIKLKVFKLQTLITNPYNTIINNISLLEERDIASIISDRYLLLNLNIIKEKLEPENLDDLINTTNNIVSYLHILNSSISLDQIFFCIKALPIINGTNS